MMEINPDQPLLPSVLDRLIDDEPTVHREAPKSRNQSLRELKTSVRRDLENLLNTRVRALPWPGELKELKQSLVNYGIPDLTGVSVGSKEDQEKFARTVRDAILMYEPRMLAPRVQFPNFASDSVERSIRFTIIASLQAEPAPEPIEYDSTLDPTTGTFQVKGERSA
jgi:type VI secretion system protein ImpF